MEAYNDTRLWQFVSILQIFTSIQKFQIKKVMNNRIQFRINYEFINQVLQHYKNDKLCNDIDDSKK